MQRLWYRLLLNVGIALHVYGYVDDAQLFYETTTDDYISLHAFKALADHLYDPRVDEFQTLCHTSSTGRFEPTEVKAGDCIFVRDVHRFMKKVHPHITQPYIMLTAGERRDQVTPAHRRYLYEEKLIAWFAVHNTISSDHKKLRVLPLGINTDSRQYAQRAQLAGQCASWRATPKKGLLYLNVHDMFGKKTERQRVIALLQNESFCYRVIDRIPFLDYMHDMSYFKFAASPSGYGPDAYRTWEALMVGTIPIVRSSMLDPLYHDLPVLIVTDWRQITEEFLEEQYERLRSQTWSLEKLFIPYWQDAIEEVRQEFLRSQVGTSSP